MFAETLAQWAASVAAPAEPFRYGAVLEAGCEYPLVGLRLPGPNPVVVTAGFHGDEKAGPRTLLNHTAEIVHYAAERGVGLTLYPCVNPSGFEGHTRYNASGERPNNDFLRYEVAPGVFKGEIYDDTPFTRIVPAREGLPKETAALARALDAAPPPVAALDLHQDNFIHGPFFYAYIFGESAWYRPLLARSGSLVPVLRSSIVDSGHEPGSDVHADAEGFIFCHDGSITDRFHRAGVPYTAAIETTTETPLEVADTINLIWIRGFIDLAAGFPTPSVRSP
ncbi:MAG TPA: hypothetical protein VMT03_23175 [Polyangia bacterium]|nr:hypothetical protein [Polyangia bacterium]